MHDWLERTRKVRNLAFAGLALAAGGYFASLGMWKEAAWAAVFALLNLVLPLVPLPGRKQSVPTLDIETSVRSVGARRERP